MIRYQIHTASFKRRHEYEWSGVAATRIVSTRSEIIPALDGKNEFWCRMDFITRLQNTDAGTDIKGFRPDSIKKKPRAILEAMRRQFNKTKYPYYWYIEVPQTLFSNSGAGATKTIIFRLGTVTQARWFKNNYYAKSMDTARMDKYINKRLITTHKFNTLG